MKGNAWHFLGADRKLLDGRPAPAIGETLTHDGPVEMCASGLHASRTILAALEYAPGSLLCRVHVRKVEDELRGDKLVCRERTILWEMAVGDLLRDFSRRCALDVVHNWEAPEVVIRWLKTGSEEIREDARLATWSADFPAAESAAWLASRSAVAEAAASAAWWATYSAAESAGWSATWSAAREKQSKRLASMVMAARRKQLEEAASEQV